MARPIDEKIVSMKMDNSDFVKKASQTTSIFGKLTGALNKIPGVNLGKTSQELSNISRNANPSDVNRLGEAVQTVANRFSTLGIMGTTALVNITNRAVDAGIALAKSLSLDQVTAGFQEYELKMDSIQTILANTQKHGTTLDDVKYSLEELNKYADKTIYNFGDMTKNIGLFTNAGLKLEESTSMIKGFSNAAAASGTDSMRAAAAAYQLSQGLSQGYLMQLDWMSLTNAGMGNDNMKRDLIAMGQAMGTLGESTEDTITNWKEYLSDKRWLTKDVMSVYLQTMAGDIDKATLLTMGLTEAQADMMLQNAKTGEDAAVKVRTFTKFMDALKEGIGSGWARTWELVFGDFEEATIFWTRWSESIGGFFEKSAHARNSFLEGFREKGGFANIFSGIENAAKPVIQIFTALGDGFKKVFPPVSISRAVQLTETFKQFTAGLLLSNDRVKQLTTIFRGVFATFSTVWEIAKRLTSAFTNLIPEGTGNGILDFLEYLADMSIEFNRSVKAGNGLTTFIEGLGDVLGNVGRIIGEIIDRVFDFSGSIRDTLAPAIDWIVEKLKPVGAFFKEAFGGFGGDELVGAGMLAGILFVVQQITSFFINANGIVDSAQELFEGVGEAVQNFAMSIQVTNLLLIAVALGILATSLKTLEGIKVEDLARGITALAISLGVMIGGMMLMSKFKVTGSVKVGVTLIALALAVSIMAKALKKISDIKPDELSRGMGGLVVVTGALAAAVIAMSKLGGKVKTSSLQLITLAGAVYILASAVEKMSSIKTDDLWRSIGALGIIFAQLALFLKIVDKTKFRMSSALGVLVVAGALHVMVSAIRKIGDLSVDELKKGLITIAIILAQIGIFSRLVKGSSLMAAGVGILLIAGAINALVGPIKEFSDMSWEELAKGLGAMAVSLLAIAGASMLMSSGIAGAIGFTIVAGALMMLMVPIKAFAQMSWGTIIKAFFGIAGGLTVISLTAMALTPAIFSLLGFGAALLVMSVAMLAAGVGVGLFAAGLATLATLTAGSVAAIVSALALLILGLIDLIPAVVRFVGELGSALIKAIGDLIPPLVTTAVELLIHILTVIEKHLPEFLRLGINIVIQLIEGIGEYVPKLVDAGLKMVISLIEGMSEAIRDNGPMITSSVIELIGEILILVIDAGIQMVNALFGWIPGVKDATSAIGETAEKYIRDNFGAQDVGEDKGIEFAKAIERKKKEANSSGKALGEAAEKGIGSLDMLPIGEDFGAGFAGGIESKSTLSKVASAAWNMAKTAKDKVTSWLQIQSPSKAMFKDGGWFGEGFFQGIVDKTKRVGEGAKSLAVTAKESLNKFLDGFELPEEDNELHFKAVVDYDKLDPNKFGKVNPMRVTPDTSYTNGLVTATKTSIRQNNNKTPRESVNNSTSNEYKYDIHVEAKGVSSRSEIRKLAEAIQDEIKNINDRGRISRGEGVSF